MPVSFRSRLFQFANVIERELSRLNQLRHHLLRPSAEKAQNLVEQAVASRVLRDQRLKNIGVSDLLNTVHGFLGFHPVDGVRDGCVGGARLRKRLLNLPHGCPTLWPQDLQNSTF